MGRLQITAECDAVPFSGNKNKLWAACVCECLDMVTLPMQSIVTHMNIEHLSFFRAPRKKKSDVKSMSRARARIIFLIFGCLHCSLIIIIVQWERKFASMGIVRGQPAPISNEPLSSSEWKVYRRHSGRTKIQLFEVACAGCFIRDWKCPNVTFDCEIEFNYYTFLVWIAFALLLMFWINLNSFPFVLLRVLATLDRASARVRTGDATFHRNFPASAGFFSVGKTCFGRTHLERIANGCCCWRRRHCKLTRTSRSGLVPVARAVPNLGHR